VRQWQRAGRSHWGTGSVANNWDCEPLGTLLVMGSVVTILTTLAKI